MQAAAFLAHLPHTEKLELLVQFVSNVQGLHSTINEGELVKRIEQGDRERANEILRQLELIFEGANTSLELVFSVGNVGTSIVNLAEQRQADLIVLGAIGHTLFERLLGSISDFVATHARCSVLVVRPSDTTNKLPMQVCVAVDDSKPSAFAVSQLGLFGWGKNTCFSALNIVNIPVMYSEVPYEFNVAEVNKSMRPIVERLAKPLEQLSPNVETHVIDWNHIGDGIVQFANKAKSDLIVMGDTGSGLLGRFFLGSTSRYVLRHSHCSVWIARQGEDVK
jgi:nucleotide-binding universal stress UspA family protein